MTITSEDGDLLQQQDVDAIVNTVNCVGVMGKGIALQFKKKWPENFKAYASACKRNEVKLGQMFIFDLGGLATPRFIINFPTKDHWRSSSKLEDIKIGLQDLIKKAKELNITSIAMPPLGCGNGGLDWSLVRPLIEKTFAEEPDISVRLFEPSAQPVARQLEVNTSKPKMTPGRAAILSLLELYKAQDYGLSKIEVQKLAYFLQEAGQLLRLKFEKKQFGPYADALRHALDRMDGHYIQGLGDGVVDSEITPVESALVEAKTFLSKGESDIQSKINRVASLINGFESPYGMELLASVHWVATQEGAKNPEQALACIQSWTERKKGLMSDHHVSSAWNQLSEGGWI